MNLQSLVVIFLRLIALKFLINIVVQIMTQVTVGGGYPDSSPFSNRFHTSYVLLMAGWFYYGGDHALDTRASDRATGARRTAAGGVIGRQIDASGSLVIACCWLREWLTGGCDIDVIFGIHAGPCRIAILLEGCSSFRPCATVAVHSA